MQRAVVNQSAEGGHVALVLAHKGLELPEDRAVEELKLRRERGETIDVPLRSNKPVLLAALVRARAAAPDVPRPAAAPAAAAAGGGGEALIAPTDGVEKLVGQRVEAVWEDKDGSTDWFPATIVAHWPTNSEHDRLLMHFDDGMDEIITLPDDTVRLTGEAVVARCKCARCAVRPEAEDGGCTLPLPQSARPRPTAELLGAP